MIEEGEIHQGDELILQHRPYPEWTIRRLNTLLSAPSSVTELEEALAIEELAPAFKRSVNSQLRNLQQRPKMSAKTTALCPVPEFAFLRRLLRTLSFRQYVSRNSGTTYAFPLFSVCA